MTRHLEFWTIATVVAALGWRRWRHAHGRRGRSLMVRGTGATRRLGRRRGATCNPQSRHPRRPRVVYSERDLDRAYTAGVDTGAAIGPSDKTRRRWAREGFEVPQ